MLCDRFRERVGNERKHKAEYRLQLAYGKSQYFRKEPHVNKAVTPVYQHMILTAGRDMPVEGNVFVPKTHEASTYGVVVSMIIGG